MGLLLLPLAAFAALVYYCKRKRSKAEKTKKLLEDEAERMTEEQMVTMVSYRDLPDVNATVILDSDSENSFHSGPQETEIMENLSFV